MNLSPWIDEELAALEQKNLRRQLLTREGPQSTVIHIEGRKLINFGSNDYLSLANDPRLKQAAIEAIEREGWGSGASPLITGHTSLHQRLEQHLARFEKTEAALVFSTGFAANAGTIAALAGPGDVIYCDSKNHASLWDGCRLSRADVRAYPHNDVQQLAMLLKNGGMKYRRRLIVTDTLFSMDGDCALLAELAALAEKHDAMLLVDEAHATGVFGTSGRGLCEQFALEQGVTARVGTLSKALGCMGGFVVGSSKLIAWLVNRARPYIFSTAAPAANAAAALAALEIVEKEPWRRQNLLEKSSIFRRQLVDQGWNIGKSTSQIVPLIVGDPKRVLFLSAELKKAGFFVPAIRPPTVPEGEACLRISLTVGHTEKMLTALLDCLQSLVASLPQ